MRKRVVILILFFLFDCLRGQVPDLIQQAVMAFRKGNYQKAVAILQKAKMQRPGNARIYYYLGYFSHYLAYDSRPLIGYSLKFSDQILRYLNTAIVLDSTLRNAYYFIGVEYGARALIALRDSDENRYVLAYQHAYHRKAFPPWLIEYAKNILKSCDHDGILFVGGDVEFHPIQYLQVVQSYRKDVTVIPMGMLDRPWYVGVLKHGFDKILRKVPISLSVKQIFDMHPYKWDTLTIAIPISPEWKQRLSLSHSAEMRWKLAPDLRSGKRTYLSPMRMVLVNIVETNQWERPIYFSLGCHPGALAGLQDYFQLVGIVNKLLPIQTRDTPYSMDPSEIERILLTASNLRSLGDVDRHNIPRISSILMNYYIVLAKLAHYYHRKRNGKKVREIVRFIDQYMQVKSLPAVKSMVDSLKKYVQE